MRILYFSPRNFWPPDSGACLRDYYFLRESACRASVSFLGITNGDQRHDPAEIPAIGAEKTLLIAKGKSYTGWKLLRGLMGPTPINILNYQDRRVAAGLQRLLEEHAFDLVQMEGLHLAGYLPIIRSSSSRPKVICDWHDVPSELIRRYGQFAKSRAQRLYAMRTAGLLAKMERRMVPLFDANVVVSERDRIKFLEFAAHAQVHVVENGVDVAKYSVEEKPLVMRSPGDRRDILFVGSMDSPANIDGAKYFSSQVWPKIQAKRPDYRFLIVGSRPSSEVRELAKLPGITVTGTVESVEPYYRNALAAVVPIRIAGGTRLKILEAMALHVPVVSTSVGAEGLAVSPGQDILLANTPEEMHGAIEELVSSSEKWNQLSHAGHNLVRDRYDWSVIVARLNQIQCGLLSAN